MALLATEKALCWRKFRNAAIGLVLCMSALTAIAAQTGPHWRDFADIGALISVPNLFFFIRCVITGSRLIELGRSQASSTPPEDTTQETTPSPAALDPDASLAILEETAAATMIQRQQHWKNIRSAGIELAICLPTAAALIYCIINHLISADFGYLLIVFVPYAIGSFIRLGNEASQFIQLSHALLSAEQSPPIPGFQPAQPAPASRLSQPLTLEDDPNYPPLLAQKRQRLRELIFAAILTACMLAAALTIRRFGPVRSEGRPPDLFVILSCLSPCWLVPLFLRYEAPWRKTRDVRFLYNHLTDRSGLPPLTALRMAVRDRHLRALRIAGILMSAGVVGLIPLHSAVRSLIPGVVVPPVLTISSAAAAFFGFWAFFDAAMGVYRTSREAPAEPQTTDEILRRELTRVYETPVGDLLLRRGMRVFGFLVALVAVAAIFHPR